MTANPDLARCISDFKAAHQIESDAHKTVISYLLMEPPRLAREASARSRSWAIDTCRPQLELGEYSAAIADMMARDLVWEIDAEKQSLIVAYQAADPALGPTDGIPDIGTLQISIRLAKLLDEMWASVSCERPGVIWSRDWKTDKLHFVYGPTRQNCFDFLRDEIPAREDENPCDIEYISGPTPCGPWRDYWWRKYESGFVLEVRYI